MANTQEDNIRFLTEARQLVIKQKKAEARASEQELLVKKLEKSYAAEKKAVNDSIELTIRRRKQELAASFDVQIEEVKAQERKLRLAREQEREKGVKARIGSETAGIIEDNRRLSTEIKTLYKQEKVPAWCNSLLFCAMYYPRTILEFAVGALLFVAAFGALPYLVFRFVEMKYAWQLTLVTLADTLVFGGIYVWINNHIKVAKHAFLLEGCKMRAAIRANKKKIRAVTNSIRKDKNEESYGLAELDEKIAAIVAEKEALGLKKQEELTGFENNGKHIISQEILENNRARLLSLDEDARKAQKALEQRQGDVRERAALLTSNYEKVIGKEFMTEERLSYMIELFERGEARNITEAQSLYQLNKSKAPST